MRTIGVLFVLCTFVCGAMEHGGHTRAKSMPAGRSLRDGDGYRIEYELSDLEGGDHGVGRPMLLADHDEHEDVFVSDQARRDLVVRCCALLDSLGHAQQSHNRPLPVEEIERNPGLVRRGAAWFGRHKKGAAVVLASGAICFYIGNRLARVSTMCGDAEDICSDAIDHCGGAVQLLTSCMGQTALLTSFIQALVRNGTDACISAAGECISAAQAAYELCKLCREGFPTGPC